MSDVSKGTQPTTPPPNKSTVVLLLGSIADTTWRMFIPTIGLLVLGDWLDQQTGTKPWLAISGTAIGAGISTLLIRHQLNKK